MGYDANGNRSGVSATVAGAADYANSYSYDALNRLSSLTQSGTDVAAKRVDFGYNAAGMVTSMNRYSDLSGATLVAGAGYGYDHLLRLTGLNYTNSAAVALAGYAWAYDAASRITSQSDAEGTTSFSYDNDGQLLATSDAAPTGTSPADESYTYDANGNRIDSATEGTGATQTPSTGPNNELLSDGTYDYAYDDNGNVIGRTTIATGAVELYGYDYRNRLTSITDESSADGPVTQTIHYTYDGNNNRISQTVTDGSDEVTLSEHYIYDGGDLVLVLNDAGAVTHRLLEVPGTNQVLADEDTSVSLGDAARVTWMLTDNQQSVRDVVDNTGAAVDHLVYDSYGNVTSQSDPTAAPRFQYTGMQADGASGLYYDKARTYDPQAGRFLSQDPLGFAAGDGNLYRYCGNNPSTLVDFSGMDDGSGDGGNGGSSGGGLGSGDFGQPNGGDFGNGSGGDFGQPIDMPQPPPSFTGMSPEGPSGQSSAQTPLQRYLSTGMPNRGVPPVPTRVGISPQSPGAYTPRMSTIMCHTPPSSSSLPDPLRLSDQLFPRLQPPAYRYGTGDPVNMTDRTGLDPDMDKMSKEDLNAYMYDLVQRIAYDHAQGVKNEGWFQRNFALTRVTGPYEDALRDRLSQALQIRVKKFGHLAPPNLDAPTTEFLKLNPNFFDIQFKVMNRLGGGVFGSLAGDENLYRHRCQELAYEKRNWGKSRLTKFVDLMENPENEGMGTMNDWASVLGALGAVKQPLGDRVVLVPDEAPIVNYAPAPTELVNPRVQATAVLEGTIVTDYNQGARNPANANPDRPTLIAERIAEKMEAQPGKAFPNGNMATVHGEIGVIQQIADAGKSQNLDLVITVSGEPICSYCRSDIPATAQKAGLRSLTVKEVVTGKTWIWRPGFAKFVAVP